MRTKVMMAVGVALCAVADPGLAAPAAKPISGQIQRVLACRGIADTALRLACFDREIAIVQANIASRDLVVIDRAQAKVARRSLFGFGGAGIGNLFGDGDDDEIKEIAGVVASSRRNAEGTWMIRLADGSTWTQTDGAELAFAPAKGHKVVVRRGALGSYKLSVNGQPGIKVRRI